MHYDALERPPLLYCSVIGKIITSARITPVSMPHSEITEVKKNGRVL